MKELNQLRRNAIRIAAQVRQFVNSWSEALKAGWMIAKLFLGRRVNLKFDKIDKKTGEVTVRKAVAIAMGSISTIKNGFVRFLEILDNGNTQWRSFRIENLIFKPKQEVL